jgi:hypothetical protein
VCGCVCAYVDDVYSAKQHAAVFNNNNNKNNNNKPGNSTSNLVTIDRYHYTTFLYLAPILFSLLFVVYFYNGLLDDWINCLRKSEKKNRDFFFSRLFFYRFLCLLPNTMLAESAKRKRHIYIYVCVGNSVHAMRMLIVTQPLLCAIAEDKP